MTPAEIRVAMAELDLKRKRYELFFWTLSMSLSLIVVAAMAAAFIAKLVAGTAVDATTIGLGAALTGTATGGGHLLRRAGRSQS